MAFTWSESSIRWYLEASACCDFHRRLAQQLAPLLRPGDSLYDFGCGLGRLDLELAPWVSAITCVDRDGAVLKILARDAAARGLSNLTMRRSNARQVRAACDVALLCFFGTPAEQMLHCAGLARRLLIRVMNQTPDEPSFRARRDGKKRETLEEVEAALHNAGLPYTLRRCTLDFDQPLADEAAAEAYLRTNHPRASREEIRAFLKENLRPARIPGYSLRLPRRKNLAILAVETGGKFDARA